MSRTDSGARRALRTFGAILAALTFSWAVLLVVTGGFDTRVLGMPLTAHNPYRPLLAAGVCLSLYFLVGGDVVVAPIGLSIWRALVRVAIGIWPFLRRSFEIGRRWHAPHLVALLGAAVFALIAIANGSKVGGGADSYGYVSEAELFLAGHVTDQQPWARDVPWPNAISTFAPLGYRAGPERWLITPPIPHGPRDPWTISPTYSPGLPFLMAGFKILVGQPGVFWVAPLSGALLVFATFAIGRRLGSAGAGLIAAWFVGTSPNVLEMSMAPMSDVPVAAAWAATYWALLGRTLLSGSGAALAGGLAIFIRPNLFFMAGPVALLVLHQIWTAPRGERWHQFRRGLLVGLGLAAGVASAASINWAAHGSPFMSGYGTLRDVLDWAHVSPNIKNYTAWFIEQQSMVALLGLAALAVPLRWVWPGVRRVTIWCLALFTAGIWIEYFFWGVFETSLYVRFLLSSWPFIMLGLANVLLAPSRVLTKAPRVLAIIAAVLAAAALGGRGLGRTLDAGLFNQRLGESKYVTAALAARAMTPENSVIISMQHGGSVRYYGGRMSVRYDQMHGAWLGRAVQFLSEHGIHSYALLDDWEAEQFESRFPGDPVAALIKQAPLFRHREVALFDLVPGTGVRPATILLPESAAVLAVVPPAPRPSLVLRK